MSFWSQLPDDIKGEVLNCSGFLASHHLRHCSKGDLKMVDAHKVVIQFLKFEISHDSFAIIIVQNPSEVLRIDVKDQGNSEISLYKSCSLNCENHIKVISNTDIQSEITHLLTGIFRRKLGIESCSIENNIDANENPILQIISQKIIGIKPKRIILSGKSFSKTRNFLNSLKASSEITIRNWTKDRSRDADSWREMGLKVFEVSRFATKEGVQEHITASIGIGLVSYLAHIESNPQSRAHWIPGFQVEDPESTLRGYGRGTFEKYSNYSVFKVPVDAKKTAILKFTKCGISIQVGELKKIDLKHANCGLDWMCSNCAPKTMENWFFQETIGKLMF